MLAPRRSGTSKASSTSQSGTSAAMVLATSGQMTTRPGYLSRTTRGRQDPLQEIGTTGLRQYGGFVIEEWLSNLQGRNEPWAYREMIDNDPVVGGILFAIDMMARRVSWWAENTAKQDDERTQFVYECMNDMSQTWSDFVSEALSFCGYGWAFNELCYKRRDGSQKEVWFTDASQSLDADRTPDTLENSGPASSKYTDGRIGWRKIPVRGQETLLKWHFDGYAGIAAMEQIDWHGGQHVIPIQKALLFRTTTRRNNPQGRSLLRNCWVPYYSVKNIQALEAIGIERDLAGIPVATPPDGIDLFNPVNVDLLGEVRNMVTSLRRDEYEGIVLPSKGWELELLTTGGSRQIDTDTIIRRYEQRIAASLLADFLLVGLDGMGSYAMVDIKSDLFGIAMDTILDLICEPLNRYAIPRLLALNGMSTVDPPQIRHSSAGRIDLEKVGVFFKDIAFAGAEIPWSKELISQLFGEAGLPASWSGEGLQTKEHPTGGAQAVGGAQRVASDTSDPNVKGGGKAPAPPTQQPGGSGEGSPRPTSGAGRATQQAGAGMSVRKAESLDSIFAQAEGSYGDMWVNHRTKRACISFGDWEPELGKAAHDLAAEMLPGYKIDSESEQGDPRRCYSSALRQVVDARDAGDWTQVYQRGEPVAVLDKGEHSGTMVSLDIPAGLLPDYGESDHHITIVYAGKGLTDDAFRALCMDVEKLAGETGPLEGTVRGIGSFPPSESSDWLTPVWAVPDVEKLHELRAGVEQWNASEHKNFQPHVSLGYFRRDEPLPPPVPDTPVSFTHLAVHRGDEVHRFPLGVRKAETVIEVLPALQVRYRLLASMLERDIQAALRDLGREAAHAYETHAEKAGRPDIGQIVRQVLAKLNISGWVDRQLTPVMRNHAARVVADTRRTVARAVGRDIHIPDEAVKQITSTAGVHLDSRDLEPQIRASVEQAIQAGFAAGANPVQTARLIRDAVPQGRFRHAGVRYRSELIARDQTADLQREAALAAYEAMGNVTGCRIRDGIYGPPRSDQRCMDRDGEEVSLEEARNTTKYHPLCTLGVEPIVAAGGLAAAA